MSDLYFELISLTLPEGLPDFFELISVKKEEGVLCLYLEEKNIIPMEHRSSGIHSKGFHAEVRVNDFPLRGKKVLLCIKKRRWETLPRAKSCKEIGACSARVRGSQRSSRFF